MKFDGADIVPNRDNGRLATQLNAVWELVKDGKWRTLEDISSQVNAPPASVSAQLRNLRKQRFGGWDVQRRHVRNGLYEYRIGNYE